jgi:hypothetical protein
VPDVRLETKLVMQSSGEAIEVTVIKRTDAATRTADEVMVAVLPDPFEFGIAATHVRAADKSKFRG